MTNFGNIKLIKYYCELIIAIHQKHQQNFQDFCQNVEYQYAISMGLIQIGELANKLTVDFKAYFPDIQWYQIKSFRNRLAHQYGSIDVDLTYLISTNDIVELDKQLSKIISDFEEEYPAITDEIKNENLSLSFYYGN